MIQKMMLENFLPFRDCVELSLANQGLVLIKARNEISQAADSNGSGKTSLLHAICWGLFGEDLVGRRADAVACRFNDGRCAVSLFLEDSLGAWSIMRSRRPTGLVVTGIAGVAENEDMAVTQEKIDQRLGFGMRTFKNAVVFGQGAFERFANAGQDDQLRMLDEIQGVDFRDALKRAQEWRRALSEQLAVEVGKRDAAAAVILSAEERVAGMRRARDSFEADRRAQVDLRFVEWKAATVRHEDVVGDRKRADEDAVALKGLLASQAEAETERARMCQLDAALGEAEFDERECSERLRDLEGRLGELFEEEACPTCRQPVKSRRAAITKLFGLEVKELERALGVAKKRVAVAEGRHAEGGTQFASALEALGALVPGGGDAGRHVALLTHRCGPGEADRRSRAIKREFDEMGRLEDEIKKLKAAAWSGRVDLADAEEDLAGVERTCADAAARAEKVGAGLRVADYWVEAFGDRGVRSLLVDSVADFVNERVAAHLEVLAAGEAQTRMSAQTELKRGGARERISFRTEWAWGGAGPDDGSGGQDRRKDLAVFAAMQDLAESRSARPFPVKVFDEPFDALDSRGKELAVEWVRRQARARGTVLLVTHSEEMAALVEPDATWTVVMSKGGARVEVS